MRRRVRPRQAGADADAAEQNRVFYSRWISGGFVMGVSTVPVLELRRIRKAFAGLVALHDAALTLHAGSVHALVGENGAGKSTLIKVLAGVYPRDSGDIVLDGRPVDFRSPLEAQASGVSTIYQEVN